MVEDGVLVVVERVAVLRIIDSDVRLRRLAKAYSLGVSPVAFLKQRWK